MSKSLIVVLCFLTHEEIKQLHYPIDAKTLHRTLWKRRDEICDFYFGKEYARMVDKDWKLLELIQIALQWTSLVEKYVGKQEDEVVSFIDKAKKMEPVEYYAAGSKAKASFFQK
jgi:hypothetical protein